ncbi:biotin--[acetyl-CoA-carboxylase] ligase [Paraoerskovia sediminicola]|uniref:biotin--[acetyl-CoA-carboxylase] ligase n=1 Tax=Paraoerskovia sediminicola TaxID=1138587 RepID=UPI002572274E|nr:hypothetical protein [Paraoerskovia sediminicola]
MPTTPETDQPDRTAPAAPVREPLRAEALRTLLSGHGRPVLRVEVIEAAGSTSAELAAAVRADPEAWPAPSLLVAEHQSAGRGRSGREWSAPPRSSLLASILLRPAVPAHRVSWLPILAGLAAAHALRATAGVPAVLKWPNDVLLPAPTDRGDGVESPDRELDGWGTCARSAGSSRRSCPTAGRSSVSGSTSRRPRTSSRSRRPRRSCWPGRRPSTARCS